MIQTGYLPTNELLMGVSAVEEHGKLGAFRQVKLLLKVSVKDQKEQEEGRRELIFDFYQVLLLMCFTLPRYKVYEVNLNTLC